MKELVFLVVLGLGYWIYQSLPPGTIELVGEGVAIIVAILIVIELVDFVRFLINGRNE